jgi:hypothetical protein
MSSARSLRVPAAGIRGAIGVMVVFIALELLTRAELVTPEYLPPASEILGETARLFGRAAFWEAFRATMQACLAADADMYLQPLQLHLSQDFQEASRSFVEKRPPVYQAR